MPENTLDAADFSQQADGKVIYTGGKYLTGIDVSAHQGEINWKKVAKQVDFAMIQVGYRGYTEGKLAEDERFRENIQQALKYKMKVGVYFFSQAITAEEALPHILRKVRFGTLDELYASIGYGGTTATNGASVRGVQ